MEKSGRRVLTHGLCFALALSLSLEGCKVRGMNESSRSTIDSQFENAAIGDAAKRLFEKIEDNEGKAAAASKSCTVGKKDSDLLERINETIKVSLVRAFTLACVVAPFGTFYLIAQGVQNSAASKIGEPRPALVRQSLEELNRQKVESVKKGATTKAIDARRSDLQGSLDRVNGTVNGFGTFLGLIGLVVSGVVSSFMIVSVSADASRTSKDSTLQLVADLTKRIYGAMGNLAVGDAKAQQQREQAILDDAKTLFRMMDDGGLQIMPRGAAKVDPSTGIVRQRFVVVPDYVKVFGPGTPDLDSTLAKWPENIPKIEFDFTYSPASDEFNGKMILVRPPSHSGPEEVLLSNKVFGAAPVNSRDIGSLSVATAAFRLSKQNSTAAFDMVRDQLGNHILYYATTVNTFREFHRPGNKLTPALASLPQGKVLPVNVASDGSVRTEEPVPIETFRNQGNPSK